MLEVAHLFAARADRQGKSHQQFEPPCWTTVCEQRIQITASGGLAKEEVDRLAREAEEHRAEDERLKEAIETRNRLDGLVYGTRKTLDENKAKLSAGVIDDVTRALDDAQKLLDARSDDSEGLRGAETRVTEAAHRMAEELYKAAPGGGGR